MDKHLRTDIENFLPDLCNVQSVLALILIGELLALALTIVALGLSNFSWLQFGMVSIAVQWIILTSAALICPLRPWFDKAGGLVAGAVSYIIVLLVTFFVSLAGIWVSTFEFLFDWSVIFGNLIVASVFAGVFLLLQEAHQESYPP